MHGPAEVCEARLLLTAPELHVTYQGGDTVAGYVRSDTTVSGDGEMLYLYVEVDLNDDGTIDDQIEGVYDGVTDCYYWSYQPPGAGTNTEDLIVSFRPVELVGASQNVGEKVVVTIPPVTNDAPVLHEAHANNSAVWGRITDDNLATSATFRVEVAVGQQGNGFADWGEFTMEDTFYVTNPAPAGSGTMVLWVRVREISAPDSAVSNVVRVEYQGNGGGAPGGASGGGSPVGGAGAGVYGGGEYGRHSLMNSVNEDGRYAVLQDEPVEEPAVRHHSKGRKMAREIFFDDSDSLLAFWMQLKEKHEELRLF